MLEEVAHKDEITKNLITSFHSIVSNLCTLCREGDTSKINNIIDQYPFILDVPTPFGLSTPLSIAIQFGKWSIVEILLENGAKNVIENDAVFLHGHIFCTARG